MSPLSSWKVRTSLFATVLAIASIAPAGHAQAIKAHVNVPFAFEYGSHHFDAGPYTLSTNAGPFMSLQGSSRLGLAVAMQDIDTRPAKSSKVVFRRYGAQYFLQEVWIEGRTTHLHCDLSKAERQAARRQIASSPAAPTGVELAVLQMPR